MPYKHSLTSALLSPYSHQQERHRRGRLPEHEGQVCEGARQACPLLLAVAYA